MNNWRLLLTRSAPDCQLQAEALQTLGIFTECLPLLKIVPLPETATQRSQLLDFDRYTSLIVISKPAAKLILERLDYYWPQLPIQQTWFTVGEGTAKILQAAGLNVYYPQTTDNSEALWQLTEFQQHIANPHSRVLIIKGQGGREWLTEQLQLRGITTEAIELYSRQTPHQNGELLYQTITAKNINAIVVSSGQALHNLYHLISTSYQSLKQLPLFVPSVRVAEQALQLGFNQVINCKSASQQALVTALKEHQTR